MIDRDKLNSITPRKVAQASMAVIDAIQTLPKHEQVAAIAATFITVCGQHRIDGRDVLAVTARVLSDDIHGVHPEYVALRNYVAGELADALI